MTDSLLMSTTDTSVSESLQNLVQMFFSILTDNVFNATVPLFPSCTIQETHRLTALCPGPPGWTGTSRNIHPIQETLHTIQNADNACNTIHENKAHLPLSA